MIHIEQKLMSSSADESLMPINEAYDKLSSTPGAESTAAGRSAPTRCLWKPCSRQSINPADEWSCAIYCPSKSTYMSAQRVTLTPRYKAPIGLAEVC